MKFSLNFIFILAIIPFEISGRCAMRSDCPDPNDPACLPYAYTKEAKPEFLFPAACGNIFTDEQGKQMPVCCSPAQNQMLISNFVKIDATFGSKNSGCDNCAANIKRFWCLYTCAANQGDFVQTHGYVDVMDPVSQTMKKVQNVTMKVDSQTACDLYDSCGMTPYCSQVSAMSTPAGFINFQGSNAVSQGSQFIKVDFAFNDKINSLVMENQNQCQKKWNTSKDAYGFPIAKNCSCNSCAAECGTSTYEKPDVMYGFEWKPIVILYSVIIVITILSCIYKNQKQKRKERTQSSRNDYRQVHNQRV